MAAGNRANTASVLLFDTARRMKLMRDRTELGFTWRSSFRNAEVNRLHAEGFGHRALEIDWRTQLENHSLGWVCGRRGQELIGFVNVAWDGGVHAFALDTVVASSARRAGLGAELVARAALGAGAARSSWTRWSQVRPEEPASGPSC